MRAKLIRKKLKLLLIKKITKALTSLKLFIFLTLI